MKLTALGIAAAIVSAVAAPAFAHHSFAMFDSEKSITIRGTVKEYEWTNPHSWIRMMVADASGKSVQWGIEMASPALQAQRGWTPTTLKPGDEISVTIHPLKDGSRGGQLMSASLPGGKRLINPRQVKE